ncbi:glycosyltransferase [Mucilaginibacter calamicampi]|uniref:Glycosyltransferase n=1 Tax=Mucilaginibacter calamicampi TaxID=1302352 RepID=A0ABW2Z0X5_9SPHI
MKKVLYFFPDDVAVQNAGNKTRALELLKYFKHRQIAVDFASLQYEGPDRGCTNQTIDFVKDSVLAQNVYLLPRKPGKSNALFYFLKYKLWDLFYYWFTFPLRSDIPTFMTLTLKRAFEELLQKNQYDHVVISYIYYAELVGNKELLKGATTIIDTHDFITAQFKYRKSFNLGITFQDEIKRLDQFNEVWAISGEEQYVFGQFCKTKVRLVPLMMEPKTPSANPPEKKYDLIYVASNNVHNERSAKWFFDEVYPLLPKNIRICMVGGINKVLGDREEAEQIVFADDLDNLYTQSKISLCPMLTGTGVKVKVVEALAHALPVVCTTRGVDGLPNKTLNGCLVTDDSAQFAHNIVALLNDNDFYKRQSRLAEQAFSNGFSTETVYTELDKVF